MIMIPILAVSLIEEPNGMGTMQWKTFQKMLCI